MRLICGVGAVAVTLGLSGAGSVGMCAAESVQAALQGPSESAARKVAYISESGPLTRKRHRDTVISVDQIPARFVTRGHPRLNYAKAWSYRQTCRQTPHAAYCRAHASRVDFAVALIRYPDEDTAPLLSSVLFPVIDRVPPVAYLFHKRRRDYLRSSVERADMAPASLLRGGVARYGFCAGQCEQYVGVVQGGLGNGVNSASIEQSGPNVALASQTMNGSAYNIASISQFGACNHAFVLQAAVSANNIAIIQQSGYRNTAAVNQR